ncbi:MAG: FecR domain-containing protein [Ginsengibacter sp.]
MKVDYFNDMDDGAQRVAYLIAGFIKNALTENEHDELDSWVNESDHNMLLFEDLTDERNLMSNLEFIKKVQRGHSSESMQLESKFRIPTKKNIKKGTWIAAASIVVLLSVFFVYKYTVNKPVSFENIALIDTTIINPGGNRATLTLGNGKVIDLANAGNGDIENSVSAHVSKSADGELVYAKDSIAGNDADVHTLSTPLGGQYMVTLADGTKVWLNAATTIKYLSVFSGKDRKVEMKGEAYFEVAKNAQKPFRVLLEDSTTIEVIGTHFNVQAYKDEKEMKVTLLEGIVNVVNIDKKMKLAPGTQAVINGKEITKREVSNIEEIIGWKDGLFIFHDASIESIMTQIGRWFDAKIVYQSEIKQLFNVTLSRKEPLTKILKLLELNGYVHFTIKNKTIYVLQ